MTSLKPQPSSRPLAAYKRDATRLLKALRGDDERTRTEAEQRLARQLQSKADTGQLQLKHALAVVARESGFASWTDLKASIEKLDFSAFFGGPSIRDSLNSWFSNYEEARAHQIANGGILLPYRNHYFVSSLAILGRLGFEDDHPDWRDIGHDFARPASSEAHARITASLERRFGRH